MNEEYPEDRIELLKRISPPTPDVSYPVDLFVRKPAQIWNMPVERTFGKWNVLSRFQLHHQNTIERADLHHARESAKRLQVHRHQLDAAKDLRLDPNKEYIVYEFWSKKLIGTFKGTFVTRPLNPYDCDIYSIVEKQDRPVLISTSRHIRQMAFDIKDLAYDGQQTDAAGRFPRGCRRSVSVADLRSGWIHGKASGVVGRTYGEDGDQRPSADGGLHFFNGQGHRMESVLLRPNSGGAAAAEGA